uniref:Enhancer of polycomb-like protein n=1 Tax=Clastoptera arizonana TaxID=38151 RepID=A0A1B6CUK2_9HEMI
MNKLSFRARALDASKPMPIYMSEEIPDLPEYSAINRAVPQMPSGMEKEEECEHHLQRAIVTGLIIPTPEVTHIEDTSVYDRLYPPSYKAPRQLIHMQPFTMEHDIPDYDMDSEDEVWVSDQVKINLEITPLKFEEMMDRLEKNSGHSVVTQSEAKLLLNKEDDDVILAVYDYWLNKRLKQQTPLIPFVKTEGHRGGSGNNNNPYLAFRRRTEKMQTRKNRKNDEASYEKMIKLRRELSRALTILELVKRRENSKRELCHLNIEIFEKRYQAKDFTGQLLAEVSAMKQSRPAFAPIFTNQYGVSNHTTNWTKPTKEDGLPRKEKRQYKRRKHKGTAILPHAQVMFHGGMPNTLTATDDEVVVSPQSPHNEENPFVFQRNKFCKYQAPISNGSLGNWPWCSRDEGGMADRRFRYSLTSLTTPTPRCIGYARRRLGRGGRVLLDRAGPQVDDYWKELDFTILGNTEHKERLATEPCKNIPHFAPIAESTDIFKSKSVTLQVDDITNSSSNDCSSSSVQLFLSELFPSIADAAFGDCNTEIKVEPELIEDEKTTIATSRIDSITNVNSNSLKDSQPRLLERLTAKPTSCNNAATRKEKLTKVNLNNASARRNMYKMSEKRENPSGSLIDRWAKFETNNHEPGGAGTGVKKRKCSLAQFESDGQTSCSKFRTTSKDIKTLSKHYFSNNPGRKSVTDSSYNNVVSSDMLVTSDLGNATGVSDALTSNDRLTVPVPVSILKDAPLLTHRNSNMIASISSLLRQTQTVEHKPQAINGIGNSNEGTGGRLIQVKHPVATYNKKKGSQQVQAVSVNNKVISWIPSENISDKSTEFLPGSQPATDKTIQQHKTKNGAIKMEVDL